MHCFFKGHLLFGGKLNIAGPAGYFFNICIAVIATVHDVEHHAVVAAVEHYEHKTELSAHLIKRIVLDEPRFLVSVGER